MLCMECLQKKTTKFVAQPPAFTPGDTEAQSVENKHVIKRKLTVATQLPIGDDVSALTPAAKQRRGLLWGFFLLSGFNTHP
jgi:hypothetical protein